MRLSSFVFVACVLLAGPVLPAVALVPAVAFGRLWLEPEPESKMSTTAAITPATSAASNTAPARRELGGSDGKPAVRSPNEIGTRACASAGEGAARGAGAAGAGSAGADTSARLAASPARAVARPASAGRVRSGSWL